MEPDYPIPFPVEVQSWNEPAFLKRALYYWARAHSAQMHPNDTWTTLCQIVGENIMDFSYYRKRGALHTTFTLTATDDPAFRMSEDLVIHTVELPKLLSAPRHERERYRRFLADPQLQSFYRARERGRRDQATREQRAREEGRRESRVETAKRMKEMGLESSVIIQATGLTEDEIAEL